MSAQTITRTIKEIVIAGDLARLNQVIEDHQIDVAKIITIAYEKPVVMSHAHHKNRYRVLYYD